MVAILDRLLTIYFKYFEQLPSTSASNRVQYSAWCSWFITFDCNSICYRKVPSSILGAENNYFLFALLTYPS
jgi:hypothetical protein